jgi:hypothetical protein
LNHCTNSSSVPSYSTNISCIQSDPSSLSDPILPSTTSSSSPLPTLHHSSLVGEGDKNVLGELPAYDAMVEPNFTWGSLNSQDFSNALHAPGLHGSGALETKPVQIATRKYW